MRVAIHTERHQELVDAYEHAVDTIRDARDELAPLLSRAYQLLDEPYPAHPPLRLLNEAAGDLRLDAMDLKRRGDFLIEADAALALKLSARVGDLVNPTLANDAIARGWTYHEAELRQELSALRALSTDEQIRRGNDIRRLETAISIIEAPHTTTGTYGDLDANFEDVRVGHPLRIRSATPEQRGRDLLIRALDNTADQDTILRDEFQAIIHDNGNLTLVLPGVIDLSSPGIGLDRDTNSVRDLDQNAIPSSHSALLTDNKYGLRIRDWIQAQVLLGAIAQGAETTIVGHSYGGDTALDLAADKQVNGVLLNITHVYSAAYHNEPQFSSVPEHTTVIAAQNIYDVPVALEEAGATVDHVLAGDWESLDHGVPASSRLYVEGVEAAIDGAAWVVNQSINEVEQAVASVHDISIDIPEIPAVELMHDRIAEFDHNVLLIEFEGGLTGVGHHQSNYTDYLRRADDARVSDFFAELDAAGFTEDGTTVSIDVTDPNA